MTNLYPIIFLLFFPYSCMMGIGDIVLLRIKEEAKSLYIYMMTLKLLGNNSH